MKNKLNIILALLMTLYSVSIYSQSYTDPIQDIMNNFSLDGAKEIWKIEADLNRDNKNEMLLTLDTDRNGRAGNMWHVYTLTKNGYVRHEEIVSFRDDALFIGEVPEFNEYGLLTYHPGGGGKGALILIKFNGNKVSEERLKIIHPQGKDSTLYKKYFMPKNKVSIKHIKLSR